MALKWSIQLNRSQLASLQSKMKQLGSLEASELSKAMAHAGTQTVGRMKQLAPVDTGRLRRNIEQEVRSDNIVFRSEAIDPKTRRDYAYVQEYGIGVPPRPYFNKTIRNFFIPKFISELRRRINNIINR